MFQAPASEPLDLQPFKSTISLPYRLTPGQAMGSFLAELAGHRIVGTRCRACNRVEVPAQDVCQCGSDDHALVTVPSTGTLTGFTSTPEFTLATVRLDGTDCDLMHRLVGGTPWAIGQRVEAVWAGHAGGTILDLAGFRASAAAGAATDASGTTAALTDARPPLDSLATSLSLEYRHARGPYYGRLFDEMQGSGRIMGIRCTQCHSVLLPPRELCDICYARTGTWADVADTGVLLAFSIIHLKFVGQTREPPYVYAEVMLDGASTKIIHVLDGVDIALAPKRLKPGMRVKAAWRSERMGSLADISHFELVEPLLP